MNFGSGHVIEDKFSKNHRFSGSGQIYTSAKEAKYMITAANNVSLYFYQPKKLELYEDSLIVTQARTGQDNWHARYRGQKIFVHPKFTGPESGYDIAIVQLRREKVQDAHTTKPSLDYFHKLYDIEAAKEAGIKDPLEYSALNICGYPADPPEVKGDLWQMDGCVSKII